MYTSYGAGKRCASNGSLKKLSRRRAGQLLEALESRVLLSGLQLTSMPQDLSVLFPPTQGANGMLAQSRDIGTSNYNDLSYVGNSAAHSAYGTPGAPFSIPSVFVRQPGQIELNPSAIEQGGSERDAVLRLQLSGQGFYEVRIQGVTTAGDGGNPSVEWYICSGANNWSSPVWSATSLGTKIDVTVPYTDGTELFFCTNAGADGNDINDNACFSNLTVTGVPDFTLPVAKVYQYQGTWASDLTLQRYSFFRPEVSRERMAA